MKNLFILVLLLLPFNTQANCDIFDTSHVWLYLEKVSSVAESGAARIMQIHKNRSPLGVRLSESLYQLAIELKSVNGVPKGSNNQLVFEIESNPSLIAQMRFLLERDFNINNFFLTHKIDSLKFNLNIKDFDRFVNFQINFMSRIPIMTPYYLNLWGVKGVLDVFPSMREFDQSPNNSVVAIENDSIEARGVFIPSRRSSNRLVPAVAH